MKSAKKWWRFSALALFLVLAAASGHQPGRDQLYQVSTIAALSAGELDGRTSFRELLVRGDFGLGTFEGLDGEMIELDRRFYRAAADGTVSRVALSEKTPFAMATFFDPDLSVSAPAGLDYQGLQELLSNNLDDKNIFYAIKARGTFNKIKVRSVHKQSKPYPGLGQAVKDQAVFDYDDISGTLVGFYCPELARGMNSPGFHFHFISDDLKKGGHVLELESGELKIQIDPTENYLLNLPPGLKLQDSGVEAGKQ